jgi:hypothetical protein
MTGTVDMAKQTRYFEVLVFTLGSFPESKIWILYRQEQAKQVKLFSTANTCFSPVWDTVFFSQTAPQQTHLKHTTYYRHLSMAVCVYVYTHTHTYTHTYPVAYAQTPHTWTQAIDDYMFSIRHERFKINPPSTKEAYYARMIFDQWFPAETAAETVPGDYLCMYVYLSVCVHRALQLALWLCRLLCVAWTCSKKKAVRLSLGHDSKRNLSVWSLCNSSLRRTLCRLLHCQGYRVGREVEEGDVIWMVYSW